MLSTPRNQGKMMQLLGEVMKWMKDAAVAAI
jgi:hypothetical protein